MNVVAGENLVVVLVAVACRGFCAAYLATLTGVFIGYGGSTCYRGAKIFSAIYAVVCSGYCDGHMIVRCRQWGRVVVQYSAVFLAEYLYLSQPIAAGAAAEAAVVAGAASCTAW